MNLHPALLYIVVNYPDKILAIYPYGSRVYGSAYPQSDYDYIIVVDNGSQYASEWARGDLNLNIFRENEFQQKLDNHDIDAIEAFCTEPLYRHKDFKPSFVLDLVKLRCSFSAKASNSWAKAHKKISLEDEDTYIGMKSIFHAVRIPLFGLQIAKLGTISDFTVANRILRDLRCEEDTTWEILKTKYKPIYNKAMAEFRKVAPKE